MGLRRVWYLTAGVVVATAAAALAATTFDGPQPPIDIPWFVLAAVFYVAEVTVVHVRFRRDAHSFSMSELPLVLSLFFADPLSILSAQFVGSLAALGITRRQQPVKLAFNLAQLSLQTAVMVAVFWSIVGNADPLGPRGWLAVFGGIGCTLVISNALISSAIALSGGSLSPAERATMYSLTTGAGLMNAALGLVAATLLWARPQSIWIAAVPPIVLFFAYRAYLAQRLERDRVQSLYEVSGDLHRLPHLEDALGAAVDRARSMFDAEVAEILLYPEGLDCPGYVTRSRMEGEDEVMAPLPPNEDTGVADVASGGGGTLVEIADRVVGMVVPIPTSGTGVLRVMTPRSDISGFSERDLQLLSTLAGHVGVSLENGRLEDSLAKLTELKDRLRHQALHDGLTGVANRSLLLERLITASRADSVVGAVLFLDLDDFKAVNDGYGHEAGDSLLVQVARRLESCSRPTDTVARLGGDEFAVLLARLASPDDAVTVAKRIISALEDPFKINGHEAFIHASVGVAMIEHGADPDDILRAADEAMYVAKGDGKGTYRVHTPGLRSTHSRELTAVNELRAGIKAGQLVLHHQPIFDLLTGKIETVEALVRWNHPDRGLIGPDDFVPMAERRRVIDDIGEWVVRNAVDALARWRKEFGDAAPAVSINLSASELNRPGLVRGLIDMVAARNLHPSWVQVEITESAVMSSGAAVLDDLRSEGVRVALDDFGTGYSSLAYLDRLPVDTVKLARAFIERIGDARVATIVQMIIGTGDTLGFTTVAEGIETPEQLAALRRLGCLSGQGFHLARPLPEPELIQMIASTINQPNSGLRLVAG
ncbi:MAG: EAL domain-containing protein [Acidimicrobiia bacterium]|nr:EAL domain-containing protein [Acidimicrobiia bacterium]